MLFIYRMAIKVLSVFFVRPSCPVFAEVAAQGLGGLLAGSALGGFPAAPAHGGVNVHVAPVAKGLQVERREHPPFLLGAARGLLDGAAVVYLGGGARPALGLAPLAQRVSREPGAPEPEPTG